MAKDIGGPSDGAITTKKKKKSKSRSQIKANTTFIDDNNFFGFTIRLFANALSLNSEFHPFDVTIDSFANHSFGHNRALCMNIIDTVFDVSGSTGSGKGTEIGTLPCFGNVVMDHCPER